MSGRGRRWLVPAVVAVVAAVVASTAVVLAVGGGNEASASVRLEPAGSPGPDPFTDAVGIGEAGEFPSEVRAVVADTTSALDRDPATGALTASGTTPGLYGGSGRDRACDPDQLVEFLTANPAKAAAWASVVGIRPSGIERFVAGLTPALLTTDTWVTNHGFADGRATPRQSVLQAGTAVLVDARGVPRVRCACGNPLGPPAATNLSDASVLGSPWRGFGTDTVTRVSAGRPVRELTLVNTETGDTMRQRIGAPSGGGRWLAVEGRYTGSGGSTIVSSTDGREWTELARLDAFAHGLAHGNGRWVAAASTDDQRGVALVSRDGRIWEPSPSSDRAQYAVGFGGGRFLIGSGAGDAGGAAVISASRDGETWEAVGELAVPGWWGTAVTDLAYSDGTWVAVASEVWDFDPEDSGDAIPRSRIATSDDGVTWEVQPEQPLVFPLVTEGDDGWLVAGATGYWNSFVLQLRRSADGARWSANPAPAGIGEPYGLAFGNGRYLLAAVPAARSSTVGSGMTLLGSEDGRSWSPIATVPERLSAIAYG